MKEQYNNKKRYDGKWVLYKNYGMKEYISIFVVSIKDGIVKYFDESNTEIPRYADEEDFKRLPVFIVNPIQMPSPYVEKISNREIDDGYAADGIKSCNDGYTHKLDTCQCGKTCHSTCSYYDNGYCTRCVLCSYPPQYQRCHFVHDGPQYKECSKT